MQIFEILILFIQERYSGRIHLLAQYFKHFQIIQ